MHLLQPEYQITAEILDKIVTNRDKAPQFSLENFSDTEAHKLAQAIIESAQLETVYLYFTARSNYTPALKVFLDDLNKLSRPIGLNLHDVKLDSDCLDKIAELLTNDKLRTLSVYNCQAKPVFIRPLLIESLKSHALQELQIDKNSLGDAELNLISELLPNNKSLHTLTLSGNKITEDGIKVFSEALSKNECLHTINLSSINLTTAATIMLINVLIDRNKKCPIKSLSLSFTKITDATAEAISSLLQKTNIEKLDISGNFFSETSLKLFHDVVASNSQLKEFRLYENKFFPGHPYPRKPDFKKYPEQKRLLDEIEQKVDSNNNNLKH